MSMKGFVRRVAAAVGVFVLAVLGTAVVGPAAWADHPDGWPEALTADMLSEDQKAQIFAAYSDSESPEEGTPEAFVEYWGRWWTACLTSNPFHDKVRFYSHSWMCTDDKNADKSESEGGIDTSHEFTELYGSKGFLQALVGNYVSGYWSRASENQLAGAMAAMNVAQNGGSEEEQKNAADWAWRGSVVGVPAGVTDAVTNPQGQVAKFMNQLKKDSIGALEQGLGFASEAFSFRGDAKWFRDAYAAAAGVGLVLLAGNLIVAIARASSSDLPAGEAFGQVGASFLLGMVGLLFTPVFAYVLSNTVDGVTEGVVGLLGSDPDSVRNSLLNPASALTTSSTPLGWLGALLIYLLCFTAAVMLLLTLAAQLVAAYLGAVGLGVMWGFVSSESDRRRLVRAVRLFVAALFAKPIIFFFLWVVMKLSSAYAPTQDGWDQDPMGTLFRMIVALVAVHLVATGPVVLARFMPVAGGRAGGPRSGGGRVAAAFAAGGAAAAVFGERMRRFAPATGPSRAPRVPVGGGGGFAPAGGRPGGAPADGGSPVGGSGGSGPAAPAGGPAGGGAPGRGTAPVGGGPSSGPGGGAGGPAGGGSPVGGAPSGGPGAAGGAPGGGSAPVGGSGGSGPAAPAGGPAGGGAPVGGAPAGGRKGGDYLRAVAARSGRAVGAGAVVAGTAAAGAARVGRAAYSPLLDAARAAGEGAEGGL